MKPRPVRARGPTTLREEGALVTERLHWEGVLAAERARMDARCERILAVLNDKDKTIARLTAQAEAAGLQPDGVLTLCIVVVGR